MPKSQARKLALEWKQPDFFKPSEERHGAIKLYQCEYTGGPWPQDIANFYKKKIDRA